MWFAVQCGIIYNNQITPSKASYRNHSGFRENARAILNAKWVNTKQEKFEARIPEFGEGEQRMHQKSVIAVAPVADGHCISVCHFERC
jgi:hypothetical protein